MYIKRESLTRHGSRKPSRSRKGHPNGYADIVAHIKDAVMKGALNPGARLPTRREIIRQFHTTPVTVQRAMDVLMEHGYIRADGARGTFVADFSPHVSHYAMAFPSAEGHPYHQFYLALQKEGMRLQSPERRITMFHNVAESPTSSDCLRLLDYVQGHRVAGVIFTFPPFMLKGSPLVDEPGTARVVIRTPFPGSSTTDVYPDLNAFFRRALEHLAGQGRRKTAILSTLGSESVHEAVSRCVNEGRRYGLIVEPKWIHGIHPDAAPWARQAMLAIFCVPASQRPESLIIVDDNLVEAATEGLAATGLSIPAEVEIIAHTNFPWPTKSHVPVTRLGFDIRRLVAVCIERIDQQRRGEKPPMVTLIPPQFETELAAPMRTAAIACDRPQAPT